MKAAAIVNRYLQEISTTMTTVGGDPSAQKATKASSSNPTVTRPEAAIPFDNEKSPGVAYELQPKRRGTLVSSRLDDRQRSNAGTRMLLVVQTDLSMSGGLCVWSPKTSVHSTSVAMHEWLFLGNSKCTGHASLGFSETPSIFSRAEADALVGASSHHTPAR